MHLIVFHCFVHHILQYETAHRTCVPPSFYLIETAQPDEADYDAYSKPEACIMRLVSMFILGQPRNRQYVQSGNRQQMQFS